jgi:hypothetical protein
MRRTLYGLGSSAAGDFFDLEIMSSFPNIGGVAEFFPPKPGDDGSSLFKFESTGLSTFSEVPCVWERRFSRALVF